VGRIRSEFVKVEDRKRVEELRSGTSAAWVHLTSPRGAQNLYH
jgi:hypothetical protein